MLGQGPCRAILLPAPTLTAQNLHTPAETIGVEAHRRGISNAEAREVAKAEVRDGLEMMGDDPHRFDDLLGV